MTLVKLFCNYCGFEFLKEDREIKRRLKKDPNVKFYCSISCASYARSEFSIKIETKICPMCKQEFKCKISNKKTNKTFCSRECASLGSVTEARRNNSGQIALPHNINIVAASLRSRENWKYQSLQKYLDQKNIVHQFEFVIENSIYDLALIDKKILIEFDGPYHQWLDSDTQKSILAKSNGWNIVRIITEANFEISVNTIKQMGL